ncbi:MAG: hypothetical protein H6765_07075 [Candidatus Peribacteria bacterium]|nr:MAG: hypothetical protein H6765_07075 [Candidatus Peribacteria bacterium]
MGASAPAELTLSHSNSGGVQQITWQSEAGLLGNVDPGEALTVSFPNSGRYRIDMQCYDMNGDLAAISQFVTTIGDGLGSSTRSAYLQANTLNQAVGKQITFATEYVGFGVSQVENVVWDM